MYQINARIRGTAPLLQHSFTQNHLVTLMEGASKRTGSPDYSLEWLATMYITKDNYLCQPATHIEGAIQRAATSFKMKGKGGKTWKDFIKAYCYVLPDDILHLCNGQPIPAPDASLVDNPTDMLSVNIMRVKVQRAAVARSRLMISAGWELAFTIEVQDEQVRPDVAHQILSEAGRAVGIGDYRPRYGRFEVIDFQAA